ncbi:maternal effect embryo arrest 60 [Quillaja saponaria]|uniref:Maternal effect embryo arrest 60 n=1 Tax=Quillaja saponaria TaxID=32244 RepID=A0AAD7PUC2_QUISA|nr:maternal effect embryo arrest 60 [Quillaja saponaria]
MSSSATSIHITALDGIVNVNSLFTLAVFIGLAWNPTDPNNSLNPDPTCNPSSSVTEDLVTFHVYSFSSFLFSSLIALGLKQAIRLSRNSSFHHPFEFLVHVNKSALRVGMLVSGVGSVSGCGFLMLALVNVVQIKLGTLSCGSSHSLAAVVPLVILVPIALLIYISVVLYAFTR